MFKEDILYGGHEELEERIRRLKSVISKCARHGDDADEHIAVLEELVLGMENILDRYYGQEI